MNSPGVLSVASRLQVPKKTIKSALVLSRIPIVTRELNKLEATYYKYQSALEKRLMLTFPQYFYFKKGTLAERRFLNLQKGVVQKQPGVWFPKGIPDVKHNRERSTKQEIILPTEKAESSDDKSISRPISPNSRTTEADNTNNVQSLERKLSRTLYLILKDEKNQWRFPSFALTEKDCSEKSLHEVSRAGIEALSEHEMNTWIVSNTPMCVLQNKTEVEFMIKSHIICGRFTLVKKSLYNDFAWLTKEEIEEYTENSYFDSIKFMLSDT